MHPTSFLLCLLSYHCLTIPGVALSWQSRHWTFELDATVDEWANTPITRPKNTSRFMESSSSLHSSVCPEKPFIPLRRRSHSCISESVRLNSWIKFIKILKASPPFFLLKMDLYQISGDLSRFWENPESFASPWRLGIIGRSINDQNSSPIQTIQNVISRSFEEVFSLLLQTKIKIWTGIIFREVPWKPD